MIRTNKLDTVDTPTREEYLTKTCAPERVVVLTNDHSHLFADLIRYAEEQPFPCANGEQFTFGELMKYQPLFILEQIYTCPENKLDLPELNTRLRYHPQLKLSQVVQNLLKSDTSPKDYLPILRANYPELRRDIEQAGITDPALASVDSFLHNYSEIASGFNKSWESLPEYYIKHILHIEPLAARPDETWLILKKTENSHDIFIPKHTRFVAGTNEDGTDFCYRSKEAASITRMNLHSVSSVIFRQTELQVGEQTLRYVDTILRKKIDLEDVNSSTVLFDNTAKRDKDHSFVITGMLIESPMLVLEQGERDVSIEFWLTEQSVLHFEEYVKKITNPQNEYINEYYRLLEDAFYLEISTEEGWTNISRYELKYIKENGKRFLLTFRLDYEFPAPALCGEKHGCVTQMPALRVLINRDAHIFPYTWARQISFEKTVIHCHVRRVSQLELINEQGQQDGSASFCPFGVRGEKGSWLVVGNYEVSIKPLQEMRLHLKWQQVPQEEGGFDTYYKEYGKAIRNDSFQVRTEYLKGKEWITTSEQTSSLFTTNRKTRMIEDDHFILWKLNGNMPVNTFHREKFRYGLPSSGFFRIKLDQPDFGFGYSVYQNLFINNILLRENKEGVKRLNEPFVPMIDSIELEYKAEETIKKETFGQTQTRIYHINPIATQDLQPITDSVYTLVSGRTEEGYLKFAFSEAESYSTIRMYIELIPSHHEFENKDISPLKWFYNNGKQWEPIEEKQVLDETDNFLNSGSIEIELPIRISNEHLDNQGLFWIYAAFEKNHLNYPSIYGIFTQVIKVEAELSDHPEHYPGTDPLPAGSIRDSQKNMPGIISIRQPRSGGKGVGRESFNSMYFRTSNQLLFRNQPVTPEDYERMVLEKFPQIDKVKCFPGCDTKNNGRKGVVTLAVMQKKKDDTFPLCSYDLLFDIEKEISQYTNPFVLVDAINPVFEEVMLRCYLKLKSGVSTNLFQKEIKRRIANYIAPWIYQNKLPEFGQIMTVAEMRIFLEKQPEVEEVHQLSLIVLMFSTQKGSLGNQTVRKLLEFTEEKAHIPIRTSHPWYIRVPAEEHLIYTHLPEEQQENVGIGELKIGSTFIIKK